jgi:hypothetical protein
MMQRTYWAALFLLMFPILLHESCGYKLSGASIPAEMKTVSVQFFENNATLVVPSLSQNFTEALKNRIRGQSRLSVVRAEATLILKVGSRIIVSGRSPFREMSAQD